MFETGDLVMERPMSKGEGDTPGRSYQRKWITPLEASQRAQVTRMTVYRWVEAYEGLGWRVAGRLRIDPDVLDRILSGEMGPPVNK
jgi:hypothetical protein